MSTCFGKSRPKRNAVYPSSYSRNNKKVWWLLYAISCFRKHVFLSLFRLSTFGAKTRNTKYARRNNDRRRHENFFVENFVWAVRNLSCCRPLFVVSSKRKGRSYDKKTCFRGEDMKTRNGIKQPP